MSNYDIQYHLRRLEEYSGEKWIRSGPPDSASAAKGLRRREKRVQLLKQARALCVFTTLALAIAMTWLSVMQTLAWLNLLFAIAVPIALRFWIDLRMLETAEDRVDLARSNYQRILEQELKDVLDR